MDRVKKKRPKETDKIKERLENYTAMQRKIDYQIERLEALTASMGSPSTPKLTGMPSGGGTGTSKTERLVGRKLDLEERIRRMIEDERAERTALEALISKLPSPEEQTVLEMRYFDRAKWWPICAAIHGAEPDYAENAQKYLKHTFKLHGSALLALARISKTAARA